MKQLFLIIFCIASIFGCQSQIEKNELTDSLAEQIVSDPLYIAYRETISQSGKNIALNVYDLDAIGEIIDQVPIGTEFCTNKLVIEKMPSIKGGKIYYENFCLMRKQIDALDKKYAYLKFSDEEIQRIYEHYMILNKEKSDADAMEIFEKKFKNN